MASNGNRILKLAASFLGEDDSVPLPSKRMPVPSGRDRILRKYYSWGDDKSRDDANISQLSQNGNDINQNIKSHLTHHLSFNNEEKENVNVQNMNFYNLINLKDLHVFTSRSQSGGGGVSPSLVLVDNSGGHSINNGNGSDTNNENNGVSSPEINAIPPFDTIMSTLSSDERQSLKHLSVSAPAMRSNLRTSGSSESEFILAPSSSKSRQKKFHRHFKTVAPDEKVLDYYSCALVGDILLQGYLYITENNFAFYSNVFGYVTKVLIPVCSVVRITKERTAKIIPNAVGICTRSEKHVFASLISRDTTYKLMCKVWNYSIDQEAKEVLKITTKLKADDKGSGDLSVPDESSAESGSGNESAIEPSSPPTIGKLVHVAKVMAGTLPGSPSSSSRGSIGPLGNIKGIPASLLHSHHSNNSTSVTGVQSVTATTTTYARIPHRTSIVQPTVANLNALSKPKSLELKSGSRGPSLILLATVLLVILFLSAAILLSRISSLQDKLSIKPTFRDSDQFYQELLSWQNKLHSGSADEIHQYINMNLQQIIRVRQSLEALSLLFMSSQVENPKISEAAYHPRDKD